MTMSSRTNMGHQWNATHDSERVECMFCLCSPLSSRAKAVCPEFPYPDEEGSGGESKK